MTEATVYLIILYVVGLFVAYGYTGGIRDEMDGIGDMAFIIFWPVVFIFKFAAKIINPIIGIGELIRGNKK